MPLFEYTCSKCRKLFESYARPSEDASVGKCPSCGSMATKVGISLTSTTGSSGVSDAKASSCGGGSGRSPFR